MAVSVSDVSPDSFTIGQSVVITGTGFEAAQGTGSVVLTLDPDDSFVYEEQTIVSWSDTEIEFTVTDGSFLSPGSVRLLVFNDSSEDNYPGELVTLEETPSGVGSLSLPAMTLSASGDVPVVATGSITLPLITLIGHVPTASGRRRRVVPFPKYTKSTPLRRRRHR